MSYSANIKYWLTHLLNTISILLKVAENTQKYLTAYLLVPTNRAKVFQRKNMKILFGYKRTE